MKPIFILAFFAVAATGHCQSPKARKEAAASALTPAASPTPTPVDWKAAYQAANDAAIKWRERAGELEIRAEVAEKLAADNKADLERLAGETKKIADASAENVNKLMSVDKTLLEKMQNRESLWAAGALKRSLDGN